MTKDTRMPEEAKMGENTQEIPEDTRIVKYQNARKYRNCEEYQNARKCRKGRGVITCQVNL